MLLGKLLNLRFFFCGIGYPFELVHILHPRNSETGEVGPLEEVLDDSDFLWVVGRGGKPL